MIITIQLDDIIAQHTQPLKTRLGVDRLTQQSLAQAYAAGELKTLPEEPGAIDMLWKLNHRNHHIKLLVSRFVQHGLNHKVVSHTTDWLDRHDVPYREIFFITRPLVLSTDVFIGDTITPTLPEITHFHYSTLEPLPGKTKWETLYERIHQLPNF